MSGPGERVDELIPAHLGAARDVLTDGPLVQLRLAQLPKLAPAPAQAAGWRRRVSCLRRGLLGGGLPLRLRLAHLAGGGLFLPRRGRRLLPGALRLIEAALQECHQVDDVGGLRRLLRRRDLLALGLRPHQLPHLLLVGVVIPGRIPRRVQSVDQLDRHVPLLALAGTAGGQFGQLLTGIADLVRPVERLQHQELVLGTQRGQVCLPRITNVAMPALPDPASAARSSS